VDPGPSPVRSPTARLRRCANPRSSWYKNLDQVTANGDYEAVFHLKRPQPAFIALLAGFSPVYPCHVSPRDMRSRPIGTGPFKFVEFKPNEVIRLVRNPDYWKRGRPYLDGIEYTVIANRSTAILSFIAGKFDMTFPYEVTVPLLREIKQQAPQAICELRPRNVSTQLLVNRDAPPFDNPDLRRAMALALDRKSLIDILAEGQGDIGGAMMPPPEGLWGMPSEILKTLPGYDPDVKKSREEARTIMRKLGYGSDKQLKVKLAARNIPLYRDPAVILIDQLKEIYIDGELELVETANWFPSSPAKTTWSVSKMEGAASTTPINNSMKTMPAVRSGTLPDIAIASSNSGSSSSPSRPTSRNANSSFGTSTGDCRKTARG
jgi:peptide/nickel transport system substrate-binding protein